MVNIIDNPINKILFNYHMGCFAGKIVTLFNEYVVINDDGFNHVVADEEGNSLFAHRIGLLTAWSTAIDMPMPYLRQQYPEYRNTLSCLKGFLKVSGMCAIIFSTLK